MENLSKKPAKGILKSSTSFEQPETLPPRRESTDKDLKWDEINILQTLHPPDKDYGHMKVDEPKTPYSYYTDGEEGEAAEVEATEHVTDTIDAGTLLDRITRHACELPKVLAEDEESEDEEEELTEEEKRKKREFEIKRKIHYNEFQAVKLARKLLEEEVIEDEDDGEADKEGDSTAEHPTQSTSHVNGAKSCRVSENQ